MSDLRFFRLPAPVTLAEIARASGAVLAEEAHGNIQIKDVAPLDTAGEHTLSFFDNTKYLESFKNSKAAACFVREKYRVSAPRGMAPLVTEQPYHAYAMAAQLLYPSSAIKPSIHKSAVIASSARIASTAQIDAGVVIGENCVIGEGCHIGANSVIGDGVEIASGTVIAALCNLTHCLVGSNVILHRGVHIGQDGFGFAMGKTHIKVPQLGRVIIENHVEIGAGTTIDRGTAPDTVIGAGTKIDNLVQIGHNVRIGKGCIIVSQVGISGSTTIGDGVVIAGQAGISGHLTIGNYVKIAAKSGVMHDLPAGTEYGGSPAVPVREWHRQTVAIKKLVKKS